MCTASYGTWCSTEDGPVTSNTNCAATPGRPGPAIYLLPNYGTMECTPDSGAVCSQGIGFGSMPCENVLGFPGWGGSGNGYDYESVAQITSLSVGPAETVSGKAYQAVAFSENMDIPYDVGCSTCSGGSGTGGQNAPLNDGVVFGLTPAMDGTAPPAANCDKMLNNGNVGAGAASDEEWATGEGGGIALSDTQDPILQFESVPSGYSISVAHYRIDSFSCSTGSGAVLHAKFPGNNFTGGSSAGSLAGSACVLNSVHGPVATTDLALGKSYAYTFDYSGQVDYIAVDTQDGYGTSIALPSLSGAYPTYVSGDAAIAAGTGSPETLSLTPEVANVVDPVFYCIANGQLYDWGDAFGANPVGTGTGVGGLLPPGGVQSSLDACFAAAGWSLTDPVSWVLGALNDGVCILEWAFVPPASDLSGSAWTSPFTAHVPGLWVADAVDAADTVIGGVNTGISAGACSAPTINPDFASFGHGGGAIGFKLPQPAACGGESSQEGEAGSLFGWRGPLRDVLVFGVWLAVFLVCWRMMPFSRSGDGASAITGFGLNDSGDAIETVWTGEESQGDA